MAINQEKSERVFVTLSKEMSDWVRTRSKELGVSKSALIAVAVGQYKAQVVMTDLVSKISPMDLQKMLNEMPKK